MGKISFRSADPEQGLVFRPDVLARIFPLKEGDIFSAAKIRKALDNYKKLYGEFGYIDFVAEPDTDVDDTKKIVNLTMVLDQNKQFFVRHIEFTGNRLMSRLCQAGRPAGCRGRRGGCAHSSGRARARRR